MIRRPTTATVGSACVRPLVRYALIARAVRARHGRARHGSRRCTTPTGGMYIFANPAAQTPEHTHNANEQCTSEIVDVHSEI